MPRRALSARPALLVAVALVTAVGTGVGTAPAAAAPPTLPFSRAIDTYSRYEGQTECVTEPSPGLVTLRELITAAYPGVAPLGRLIRDCTQGGASEHKDGRAVDWAVNVNSPAQRAAAEDFLGWLLATDVHGNANANMRRLGIMYVIWDRRVFKAYRAEAGWTPYVGAAPHTDHIHISLSWAGARRETTWWSRLPRAGDSGIVAHWRGLGADTSFLGAVSSPEFAVPGGVAQNFAGGRIYWSDRTGGRSMRGFILERYVAMNATATPLGFPVADEGRARDGGAFTVTTGGKMMWHPAAGAHPVWSGMATAYGAKGSEWGGAGLPGRGRARHEHPWSRTPAVRVRGPVLVGRPRRPHGRRRHLPALSRRGVRGRLAGGSGEPGVRRPRRGSQRLRPRLIDLGGGHRGGHADPLVSNVGFQLWVRLPREVGGLDPRFSGVARGAGWARGAATR